MDVGQERRADHDVGPLEAAPSTTGDHAGRLDPLGIRDVSDEGMKQQVIGRLGRADEIAAAVLWLCRPGASFVIGVGLPVDGGFAAH